MPNMSYADSDTHVMQDLIHALYNNAPSITLMTLGDAHTTELRELAVILHEATPMEIPLRVVSTVTKKQHQPIMENTIDKVKNLTMQNLQG